MTRRSVFQLVTALLLIAAGAVSWARGREANQLASAQRALATLQYGKALEASATSATASYWSGDYGAIDATSHPLLAANAAYRAAVARGGSAKDVVTRLDAVVKQYGEVLRADPANDDAAFNYEFVVRYRAAIVARGANLPPADADEDATPHGRAGAPAKGTGQQQFKMLVPMRPDERREAEEAGKTGRRLRKG